MARSRSPDREKARLIWLKSGGDIKNTELAAQLGVSDKSIARWKAEDGWAERLKGQKSGQKRKPGAPLGNRNAVGHGAPLGNCNNLKTGRYSKRYWDCINEDEVEMLCELDDNYFQSEEELLRDQIRLLTVREHRLLQLMHKTMIKAGKSDLLVYGATTISEPQNEDGGRPQAGNGKHMPAIKKTITHTGPAYKLLMSLETQLTRVAEKKTKAILALNQIRNAEALLGTDDNEEDKIIFYLPENGR